MAWGGIPLGVSAIIQNMLHCSSSIFRYSHLCSFIASNRCKTDRHTICEGSVAREKIFLRMYEPGGTLKSTSVEWCDGMFNKRHTAALLLTPVSTAPARRLSLLSYLRKYAYIAALCLNGRHPGLGFALIDTIFAKISTARSDFHTSAYSDLDPIWPFDLKIALPVTTDMSDLSSKFKRCIVFRFPVNTGHETDRQTDCV